MSDTQLKGMTILSIIPDSPADKAGIRVGDEIIIANDVRIDSVDAYVQARKTNPVGMSMLVRRGHSMFNVKLVFDKKDA